MQTGEEDQNMKYYQTSSEFTILSSSIPHPGYEAVLVGTGVQKEIKRNPLGVAQGEGKDLLMLRE